MPSEAHRAPRPKELDLTTPPITRNASFSSDKPSLSRFASITSPPPVASPEPAYIAVSAASQIITNDHENHHQLWYDEDGIEPSGETVKVTPQSLRRVNAFLDYLLHRFLTIAKSTQLSSLKPAVSEVLKRKLAREAVAGADQELLEYMGGANEDLAAYYNGQEPTSDWDLELAWKRTRLRCMVYSSLGDMEEEDEKMYADQDHLESPSFPGEDEGSGIVSPAVAIFLTSILEFIGEQTLTVAGQAAYHRLRAERVHKKANGDASKNVRDSVASFDPSNEIAERVVVDELDTEKVAADPTLGRLWRTWKKTTRTQSGSFGRPFTSDSNVHPKHQSLGTASTRSRRSSVDDPETLQGPRPLSEHLDGVKEEEIVPHKVPLPMSDNDVNEIEVPGLAAEIDSDTETIQGDTKEVVKRSKSLTVLRSALIDMFASPSSSSPQTPTTNKKISFPQIKRSRSVPSAERPSFVIPEVEDVTADKEDKEVKEDTTTVKEAGTAEAQSESLVRDKETPQVGEAESEELDEKSKPAVKDTESAVSKPDLETSDPKTSKAKKPESVETTEADKPKTGMVAGVLAGAAAIGGAAIAGIVASRKAGPEAHSEKEKDSITSKIAEKDHLAVAPKSDLDHDKSGYESDMEIEEAEIVETTRLSMDGSKAPEIVETKQRAVPSSRNGVVPSNEIKEEQSKVAVPVVITRTGDDEENDPDAIGVARTSNISVPAVALPPSPHHSSRKPTPEEDKPAYTERLSVASSVDDEEASASKAKPAFVLAAAPASRAARQQAPKDSPSADGLAPKAAGSLAPTSKTPGAEHGVPPLTPLRELMEAAHDTSDEASSIAPSHSASASEHSVVSLTRVPLNHAHGNSVSSNYSHAKQASTSSSKYSDTKAVQPPTSHPPLERAAVQRVYTPPVTPGESMVRRSDSFGKNQRQLHTSGSGTSQVSHKLKGFIGLPHETNDKPVSQLRNSEENEKSTDANFEKLIQSGQTLQYTLTPQTVRETEIPSSPVTKVHVHPTITDVPAKPRELTPPGSKESATTNGVVADDSRPNVHRSHPSFSRPTPPNGLRSNPPASPGVSTAPPPVPAKPYIPRSTPAPPSKRTRPIRPGMPEAREARPVSNSLRDIAEFLRATGPDGTDGNVKANGGPRPVGSSRSLGISNSVSSRIGAISPQMTRSASRTSDISKRQRLQAREAVVPYGETSTDLVNFIRQGPPTTSPQIPAVGSSKSATKAQSQPASSSRSRPGASSTNGIAGNPSVNGRGPAAAPKVDRPPEVKRKQHRNKDPYAIDFSDEEDTVTTPKKHDRQESLAEFLSAVTPPPESKPQPLVNSAAAAQYLKAAQKPNPTSTAPPVGNQTGPKQGAKPNGSGLHKPGRINPSAAPPVRVATTAPQLSLSQDGSNSLFNESGSLGMDGYRLQSRGSDRNGVGQPNRTSGSSMQARSAKEQTNNINDVADFLRASGPPASSSTYAPPVKQTGSISRFFRRK